METKLTIYLLILSFCTVLSKDAKKEDYESDINALPDMASSLLNGKNVEDIGGIINNLVQSGGGKQLGDMLMDMGNNKNANEILQDLSSLMSQAGGNGGTGFDPTILTSMLSMFQGSTDGRNKREGGMDASNILSTFGNLLGQDGGLENIMNIVPMLINTVNSFTGDEAQKREQEHASHAWFLPPVVEKLHVTLDHFMNSDMGRSLMKGLGTEKFVKVLTDENGRFVVGKFLQLLENHSFRKHWIEMVTRRIAVIISYFADPQLQKQFLTTVQYVVNSFLKVQGFPKSAMFDAVKPADSISGFLNYIARTYFGLKVSSKIYVKPVVEYIHDLVKIAQKRGFFTGRGIDSSELSHKLADTINLEIIEPVARVYRAYRFAKKHPQCEAYVMCLVNQVQQDEQLSFPGLKSLLSRSTSLFASWFLSGHTGTPFWSLYSTITSETHNCKDSFKETCNEFHVEEIKVTTEFVHNEL